MYSSNFRSACPDSGEKSLRAPSQTTAATCFCLGRSALPASGTRTSGSQHCIFASNFSRSAANSLRSDASMSIRRSRAGIRNFPAYTVPVEKRVSHQRDGNQKDDHHQPGHQIRDCQPVQTRCRCRQLGTSTNIAFHSPLHRPRCGTTNRCHEAFVLTIPASSPARAARNRPTSRSVIWLSAFPIRRKSLSHLPRLGHVECFELPGDRLARFE